MISSRISDTTIEIRTLTLVYQPIVDARSGAVVRAEALLRQLDDSGQLRGPAHVFSALQTKESHRSLDCWVLATACGDAWAWPDIGISVNIHADHLIDRRFADTVLTIIDASGITPERVELEIVETGFINDFQKASANISILREAGVQIALDDFGTGYSSLSYLVKMAIDTVKVDKCFIDDIESLPSTAVIQATLALSRAMGIKVTAEGVETPKQAAILRAFGCHHLQGYHFSRPISALELTSRQTAR